MVVLALQDLVRHLVRVQENVTVRGVGGLISPGQVVRVEQRGYQQQHQLL